MYHGFTASRPFPSSPGPLYENEVTHSTFDMKTIFHSQANKTHFHKKGCALGLILKVRVFGIRKWPIRYFINEKETGADRNATHNCFWDCYWERAGQPLANFFSRPFTFLSGRLKVSKEDEDNAYAKLLACVGGQETHKQRVLWEMCKWRVIINRQRAVTRVVIRVSRTCPSTD